jgi:hypothetical protein
VRPYRGLWLWLGGLFLTLFPFLTAIAIAYFLKGPGYSLFANPWMPAALVCFLAAFACLYAALRSWAFPPWHRSAFPDLTAEIYGSGSTDTERESGSGLDVPAHLRSFNVRLASAETVRQASLTVRLYVRLVPGSWGQAAEAACPPPAWPLPPSLGLHPLGMPVVLAPGSQVSGQLVYEVPRYYLSKIAEPFDARLEIVDDLSGRGMSIPAELGRFDRSRMTPAAGGAQALDPQDQAAGRQQASGQAGGDQAGSRHADGGQAGSGQASRTRPGDAGPARS